MQAELSVFRHGRHIGIFSQDRHGALKFRYTPDYLHDPNAWPLSQSLPLRDEPYDTRECRPFFAGVLPEAEIRENVARNLGISARNDFSMLTEIGGECAGALTLLPTGEEPDQGAVKELTEEDALRVLETLPRRPLLASEEGFRLSLAGAQNKLPVVYRNGTLFLTKGSYASSHILKPDNDRFPHLVENEHQCLELARKCGLNAVYSEIISIGQYTCLLVERYDRIIHSNGEITRLHQEDFCQALGVVPEKKYQNEGGPSLEQCFNLVRKVSSVPILDLRALLDAVIFNWLIGNNDAHGKNFSFLYNDTGRARLTPLYDLVSTRTYPEFATRMAMKLGGEPQDEAVTQNNFRRFAKECGLGQALVLRRAQELAVKMEASLTESVSVNRFAEVLLSIVRARARRLG